MLFLGSFDSSREELDDRGLEAAGMLHLALVCRAQGKLSRANELLERASEIVRTTSARQLADRIDEVRAELAV